MIKTVGIITCHTPYNYGAMLQAYALQSFFKQRGVEPEIINYFPKILGKELGLFYVGDKRFKRNPFLSLAYLAVKIPYRIKSKLNFGSFKKSYLNITKRRYYTLEELSSSIPVYDAYVTGSDQVWDTLGYKGWDPAYYLQFVPEQSKRNSYAASMSVVQPLDQRVIKEIFPLINSLNQVSVRENNIKEILEAYIERPVVHVLDPVYLLSAREWEKLSMNLPREKKRYILVYPMGDPTHVLENARKLSSYTGLPIYCISASNRKMDGVSKRFDCSVPKFLRLFQDAEYVVTNSFHGTAFSIIFKKNFWSCQVESKSHRITEMLKLSGLYNRYIPYGKCIEDYNSIIDYQEVEKLLEPKIESSKQFINRIIEQAN